MKARLILAIIDDRSRLLEQYTLPTAGGAQDFLNKALATGPDASGLFELTSIRRAGDTFRLWVNPLTRHAPKVQVSTWFQGDPVTLTATFKTLPSGLNHLADAEVTVPAKQSRATGAELRLQPQQL